MDETIRLFKRPHLNNARLVMAWPDAGHVGLRVVDHLKRKMKAERLGRIEPYEFSLYPWISVKDGVIERLELMKNQFYYWQDPSMERDVVIYKSEQPAARHHEYVGLVLDLACELGVKRIYMAGSFGATGVSHEEEAAVLGVANYPNLVGLMESNGIKPYPEYKGVGNLQSSFLWFARERSIEAISLWSPMPYYIARLPFPWSSYPKCSLAILKKIVEMEGLDVGTGEIAALVRRTDKEMGKMYEELWEQAKKEFPYQAMEGLPSLADDTAEPISDEDMSRMMKDIEDFFNRGQQ